MLDVPAELLRRLSRLLAAARRRRGTPGPQQEAHLPGPGAPRAALVPRPDPPVRLAADHGISRATAYRYIDEAVDVLFAQAQGLDQASEVTWNLLEPFVASRQG